MNYRIRSTATALAGIIALASGSITIRAQATIDLENRYSNVGALMIWRVDDAGKPVELRGFASGTLIRDRVMVTAGHFTAPATALGTLPPSIRIFASFSPTDAKDPKTWIPVVGQITHPSMPHCPPPPQCDPTDDILVAPLEPGIADVGLVFLANAPPGIKPARFAASHTLDKIEGARMTIVGYGTTMPTRNAPANITISQMWDGKRRIRTSALRRVIDETWALWSIPSYVCSGDSGGAIFLNRSTTVANGDMIAANVSDGGQDCRRHNNNNRLDTRSIQKWVNDTLRDDTLQVRLLSKPPSIDGRVDENEYGAPTLRLATLAGEVRIWIVRHGEFINVAAAIPDTSFYWGDDFVVSLDPDGNGGTSPESGDRQWYLRRVLDSSIVAVAQNGRWSPPGNEPQRLGATRGDADWNVASTSSKSGWGVELRIRKAAFGVGTNMPRIAFRTYNDRPSGWWSWPSPADVPPQRVERSPALWMPLRIASTTDDSRPIAINGITVIDVSAGVRVPDQTVVVSGTRMIAVGPSRDVRVPRDARRIDGRGKYLIPGLWDMHVHTFRNRMDAPGENTDDSEVFFPAFVANGVTGVRDMSTDLADNATIRRWTIQREARRLIAPRMIGGSPLLDGKPTIQPNALPVTTVSDARHIVDSLIDGGVGYIKVYSGLQRDVYFAIAEQAKRRGVTFAGHVPSSATASEASDAGQRSIEHLTGVLGDCSPAMHAVGDTLTTRLRDSTLSRDSAYALRRTFRRVVSERLDCAPLAARFARNQTWQVPTFTVRRPRAFAHDSAMRNDSRLRFISPQLMAEWKAIGLRAMDAATPTDVELARTMFRIEQRIVGQLHAAGVPILAGTDVHNSYVYPGFSLHDELALLVESGLSPLEALRTATINPARFLGVTDSLGTIAVAKIADLVLLDGDPLADIANTKRIRAVFLNGRFLDRDALDALVNTAERAAAPR